MSETAFGRDGSGSRLSVIDPKGTFAFLECGPSTFGAPPFAQVSSRWKPPAAQKGACCY